MNENAVVMLLLLMSFLTIYGLFDMFHASMRSKRDAKYQEEVQALLHLLTELLNQQKGNRNE